MHDYARVTMDHRQQQGAARKVGKTWQRSMIDFDWNPSAGTRKVGAFSATEDGTLVEKSSIVWCHPFFFSIIHEFSSIFRYPPVK